MALAIHEMLGLPRPPQVGWDAHAIGGQYHPYSGICFARRPYKFVEFLPPFLWGKVITRYPSSSPLPTPYYCQCRRVKEVLMIPDIKQDLIVRS